MTQKTNRLHFSTRTIAMVLSIVMLIGSIATGSMLNTFAAYLKDAAAKSDALSQAATEGGDIALNAIPSEDAAVDNADEKPDLSDFEENAIVRRMKDDLAATGAIIDFATTGYSLSEIKYLKLTKSGGSEVSYDINSGNVSVNISSAGTYYFYVKMNNGDELSNTGSISNSISNWQLDTKTSTTNSCTLNVSTTGTYTFKFTISGDKVKMAVTFPSGGSTGSNEYCLTGDKDITGTSGWTNNTAANKLTYDSTNKFYKITKTVSSTSTFNFRITDYGSWTSTYNFDKANKIDSAGIVTTWQAQPNSSDKNIQMKLSQPATIEIRLDDSKSDTSAVTVVVTPTTSTVTAAVTPTGSGTAKVGGQDSATVAYGGDVTVSATPGADYLFSKWTSTNGKVTFASTTNASTTATVTGNDTVTANFVKKSYTVSKGTGTGFTITTPASNQSKQWGTTVSVAAKTSSDLYYIDYLYYLNNNEGSEVVISGGAAAGAGTATTLSGTFNMPKNNVTVYAHVHERTSSTITYGVTSDSPSGSGYVSVGEYYTSTTMKHTIDSGTKVIEGTKVNFGARPALHYKFVGWYSDAAGTTAISGMTSQDSTVTSPSGNYYAKFAAETPAYTDPRDPEAGYVKLFIQKSMADGAPYNGVWVWNKGTGYNDAWATITRTSANTYTMNGVNCYLVKVAVKSGETNVSAQFCENKNGTAWSGYKSSDDWKVTKMSEGSCYYITYDGSDYWKTKWVAASYTSGTHGADGATTAYFPVKYYVTNPELGASSVRSNMFGEAGKSVTFYHSPSNTSDYKTSRTTTGFSSNITGGKTTDASTSRTMPSTYSATPVFTATFVPKDYYKVNFSAGAGGTIKASTGASYTAAKDIKSGTSVKEGTAISFSATPASGYSVAGWTGDVTNSTAATNSISAANFTSDKTVRVYFSKSKGTDTNSGATILGYKESTSGEDNPFNFDQFKTTYVRNGRVYGYIEKSSTSQKVYDFQAYHKVPSNDEEKYTQQYYRGNNATWANTQFTADITDIARHNYDNAYSNTCYWIRFTASAKVKAIMIDLGPVESATSNKARPDNDGNTYHIIPIYNTDISKVTVYAKDASFRADSGYDYLSGIADTVISSTTGVTSIAKQTEFETAVATKGSSITVTTTVDANHRGRYYVRGFSVNGVTPELYDYNSSGKYSMTYTIPDDFDDDYLEITPIYAEHGVTNVRFYIENYDEAFQNTGWGNTLAVYPFYENANGSYVETKHNAFGGYPGQPVINNGGRRFIEVPTNYTTLTVDGTVEECHVKGVTLSNDYYDIVHREYCREVDDHLQTYDYDDFYKIYKETSDGKEVNGKTTVADQITFAFKHRTATNNFSDSSNTVTYSTTGKTVHAPYTSFAASVKDTKFQNGWEPLLDYHDRPIDLFGKQLSLEDQAKEPLLVVSDDYAITYAGRYATTWTVYRKNDTNYTKIAEIAPSALIVATQARLGTGTYPAVTDKTGFPSTDGHKLADYSDEYQALKAYADTPVQITYESAIRNNSSYEKYWSMDGGSSEVAKRSDGRWFYSYMNEEINANLRIDYTNEYTGEETTTWTSDTYRSGTNTGSVTGATVQFTNTSSDQTGPYELNGLHDTHDYDKTIYSNFNHYYKFSATEGSGYIFQGWYMERDGISTAVNPDDIKDLAGQSQMTSNATFVARYVKNPAGHITINHLMADGSTGTGTTYIGIEKSTDGTHWTHVTGTADDAIFEQVDSFSINDTDIMSYGSGYTLRVTLKTEVASDTNFDRFSASEATGDHSSEYFSTDVSTESTTSTTQFEIPVDDLFTLNETTGIPAQKDGYDTFTYYSHTIKKPELIINHSKDPNSHAKASGNFFVKVEVTDSGKSTIYHTFDNGSGGYVQNDDIVIPSTYFNTTENYYLKVYLKTDMLGFTQFEKFSVLGTDLANAQGAQGQEITITDANNKRTKEAVIIFPVSILFNNGVPTTTELPYLSKLIMPDYKYEFKYTVPSYLDKTDTITYTAKDSFAEQDLYDYMTLTNGDLAFQDDNKKKTFICSKAPYEDNFQKTIDFYQQFDTNNRQYNAGQYTLGYEVTIAEAIQETLDVRVKFPYETQSGTRRFEYLATDGIVNAADNHDELITGVYGRDWITTNGVRNKYVSGTPEFIKAPLIIYDGSTPKYFQYWSVETVATDGNASREYTRCYDYEFNLSIYQDCTITPVYNNEDFATRGMAAPVPDNYGTNPQSSGYDRFDPDVNRDRYSIAANGVSISFVENSRNQYNDGGAPKTAPTERTGAADRIYSDFLLTYDIDPKDQLNEHSANTMQAGLIIQPVAYLEKDSNGNYKVDSDTYYGQTTKYTSRAKTSAQIKDYLEGKTSINGLLRSKFDIKELDNKNRVQYFYGFDNAVPKTNDNSLADDDEIIRVGDTYRNKTIVYLAFAYIGEGTADADILTNVTVSAQPVYFTYYADASIETGCYIPSTPGN